MPSSVTGRTDTGGFTILEAMLSLVIAVLILSVVYSVHKTILTVRQGTEDREDGPVAVMRILNDMSRELMCAVPLEEAAVSLELLTPDADTNASELALLTFVADPSEVDTMEWQTIQRIHYVLRDADHHTRHLVQEITPKPFTEETTVITNILLPNIAAFRVEVLRDGNWLPACRCAGQDSWPRAARITLQRTAEEAFQTDVFLPAGCVVTSSLIRTSTAAP